MKITAFRDRPAHFPAKQVSGAPLKPITQVLLERRATNSFKSDPVPNEYLEAILWLTAQAPSGYNLQPWRFIVVQDQQNRARLRKAAMDQTKVGEAPVVVIAFAIRDEWKTYIEDVFIEGSRRGFGRREKVEAGVKTAASFLNSLPPGAWLNRHTMIAVTVMMLVAEAYGIDTAPMEGFEPDAVKREFGIPREADIIALLALGFAKEPDKPYGGRFAIEDFVHQERYGQRWRGENI